MNSTAYKIYLMSAIEYLVNNTNQIDLGDYLIETKTDLAEINMGDMVPGDSCLALASRVVNKDSGKVEYGNIFYKRLLKDTSLTGEIREQLESMLESLISSSDKEKIDFIMRSEKRLLRSPFLTSGFVSPTLAPFFGELRQYVDDYEVIALGGKAPANALDEINAKFEEYKKRAGELEKSSGSPSIKM